MVSLMECPMNSRMVASNKLTFLGVKPLPLLTVTAMASGLTVFLARDALEEYFGIAIGGSNLGAFDRKTNLSATNSALMAGSDGGTKHKSGEDPICGGEDILRQGGFIVTFCAQWWGLSKR